MTERRRSDEAAGLLVAATMILVAIHEWGGSAWFSAAGMATSVAALALFSRTIRWTRRVFLLIGLALLAIAVAFLPDWPGAVWRALQSMGFIIAFFTALTSLRSAAISSRPVAEAGQFLADQPPGRRYLALTLGGALFGLILLYGAITLLGSLSQTSARRDPDPRIAEIRIRRMMVAIQRGFIATLPWSPLTFAMAISTSLVPGSTWAGAVLPCLVSGLLLAGIGWALDAALKPRLSGPRPESRAPEGRWSRKLAPLLALLCLLGGLITILHFVTGVGVVGVVMIVVPILSLLWMVEQDVLEHRKGIAGHVAQRARDFATIEMAGLRAEIVLLAMAGFIGSLGASLVAPVVAASGIDLSGVSAVLLLLGIFWIIPITGQFGMNPILAASLVVPLLPAPAAMGVAPSAVILAITSGWALSGATSPYTASVMMVGQYGGVSALHVGLRWNGLYALLCGVALSGWICFGAILL